MRPKVIIGVIALGSLLVGALFLIRQPSRVATDAGRLPASSSPETATANATDTVGGSRLERSALATEAKGQVQSEDGDSPAAKQRAYVEARVNELMDLGMTDDPASLITIVSEVTNLDPDIRKAALEAAKQFGSRDAIPGLMAAAEQTSDADLKVEISKTIEFLKLPSLTEVLAQSQPARSQSARPTGATPGPPAGRPPN